MIDYETIEEIGKGVYGTVYKIKYKDKLYALKQQKVDYRNLSPAGFINEISVMKHLSNRHIVKAYDVWLSQDGDSFHTLMELGMYNMRHFLKLTFPEENKVILLYHILSALYFLKTFNIVHGDLKPENIIIFENGYAKLCDFGLSFRNHNQPINHKIQTLWWRAPESFNMNIPKNTSVDMWSFGVIAYQVVTGKYLFIDKKSDEMLMSYTSPDLTIIENEEMRRLISSCIEIDPEKRITPEKALEFRMFDSFKKFNYIYVEKPISLNLQLSDKFINIIKILLANYTYHHSTVKLIFNIYSRYYAKVNKYDILDIVVCCYIGLMLNQFDILNMNIYDRGDVYISFIRVCNTLDYDFYGIKYIEDIKSS